MNILVTGAAGLIGGALVAELLARGHGVVGLVHRRTAILDNHGHLIPARRFESSLPGPGEAAWVQGDVSLSRWGLDDATLTALSGIDLVIHCAALVRFEAADADLDAVNVGGTAHLIALFPKARLIHVSTAYVCGLREGAIEEGPRDPAFGFANGYERSKAEAETLILAARADAVIVRPSIVIGDLGTGRIREFDSLYTAFRLIAHGRVTHLPAATGAGLSFVPINHVVEGIARLVDCAAAAGKTIHLAAAAPVPVERFVAAIAETPGLARPVIGFPDKAGRASRLARPYLGYFGRRPVFEVGHLEALTGLASPDIDDAALRRQIDHCIAAGFIRPQ